MAVLVPEPDRVKAALEELLGWPEMVRSPQLSKFLSYIVEATLRGDEASIKAYAIAVDVFGRPPTFDPQSDPIVRVQARRLRGLLDQFYSEGRGQAGIRVRLPVGRYVPEFVPITDLPVPTAEGAAAEELVPELEQKLDADFTVAATQPAPPSQGSLLPIFIGVGALVLALTVTFVGIWLQERPSTVADTPVRPRVMVREFLSVADPAAARPTIEGLAVELVSDLELFGMIDVAYGGPPGSGQPPVDGYEFSGVARLDGQNARYSAIVRPAQSDTTIWTYTVPVIGKTDIDAVSRSFAAQLGSLRGPLHATARRWLAGLSDLAGHETDYVCRLLFSQYRESRLPTDADRAERCVTTLLKATPNSAIGLAIGGALIFDAAHRESLFEPDPVRLAEADAMLVRANSLAQTDSFVWEQRARLLDAEGRTDEARGAFRSALQLNPANSDALAAFARMLSLHGQEAEGGPLAQLALESDPAPPYWYHTALAVNALRDGDDVAAISHAERLAQSDAELGAVIAIAAAARSGDEEVLNRRLPQVLELPRFRQFGIMPVIGRRIADTGVVSTIERELLAAGITPATLAGPF